MAETLAGVDYSKLSPTAVETLQRIAVPISLGLSNDEVARSLGLKPRQVNKRLTALREELRTLAGLS
ncbi:MAG TPA: hypothetical protein VG265_11975 [Gaiellaceae bacterium]|jgi:DNA-binding CsgD family transcriptional regulator|nr:hypothetical protein [Gaiellaceae bacterium]